MPLLIKLSIRLRRHVFYHLPYFFPVALNVAIGTSYAFIFVLFFFLQVVFGLFNDLKIHTRCTENRILRIILEHLGYVLTFFCWINVWASMTSTMPFSIIRGWAHLDDFLLLLCIFLILLFWNLFQQNV